MKFQNKALSLALFLLASIASDSQHFTSATVPDDHGDDFDMYVVGFKDRASHDAFLATGVQTAALGVAELNAVVLQFDSEAEAHEWAHGRDDVVYVEKDGPVYALDEGTSSAALVEETPYGITMVNAMDIPEYVEGSGIKTCIIDSGYQRHEDLPNDNNGDPVTGKSGLCGSPCLWDAPLSDHGNHVAGTIAATGDNNKGVIGVVQSNKMPLHIVRTFENGSGSWSSVANSMLNCNAEGAHVVNMSLGGGGTSAPSIIQDAVDAILGSNDKILMIAAAGNAGNGSYSWPASMPELMSVASVDSSKNRSSFSQYNDEVDISGPGSSVKSTVFNNGYAIFSGTSMATPHVAGVAAKVWSHDPSKTAQEIRDILESTAEDRGTTGRDDYYGWGIVDAKAAFDKLGPAPPSVSPAPSLMPSSSPIEWCKDSPAFFLVKANSTRKRTCKWVKNKRPDLCNKWKVKNFCHKTCDSCDLKCTDTTLTFFQKNREEAVSWTCAKLKKLKYKKREQKCTLSKFYLSCPKTCEVEECMVNKFMLNFDEAPVDSSSSYYREDLQLDNYWSTTGETVYYGSGYMYGTISKPNVGFNGWADPITMTCPGGSFSLFSVWMTPAWDNGLSVTFTGSLDGTTTGSYSTNLNDTDDPVHIQGLDQAGFVGIDKLVIETSPSHVVMDDMEIAIISPCTVTPVEVDPNEDGAGAMADPSA